LLCVGRRRVGWWRGGGIDDLQAQVVVAAGQGEMEIVRRSCRPVLDAQAQEGAYSDESERLIRRRRTPGPMMAITVGAKRRESSVAR